MEIGNAARPFTAPLWMALLALGFVMALASYAWVYLGAAGAADVAGPCADTLTIYYVGDAATLACRADQVGAPQVLRGNVYLLCTCVRPPAAAAGAVVPQ